jgi:dolichyl-phosphate beta-glucosyltransferase
VYVQRVEQPWLSVVVPAYNEEIALPAIVSTLREHLDALGRPYEIVVVDNASQDRSVEVLEPLLDGQRVRLLRNEVNRGKGFSVRRGMLDASGELRLMCDADCGPSLESLPDMLAAIETADVVAGSRVAKGAAVDRQQPFRRRLVGWPFIALTRALMREPTRDVYCGFKLWRGPVADLVFSRQRVEGWVFDAEVLAMARRLGFRIREVGVAWADREGSKLSITQVLIPAVRELLAAHRSVVAQRRWTRRQRAVIRDRGNSSPEAELVADAAKRGA